MTSPVSVKALRRAVEEAASRRSVAPQRMQYTVASTVALQMVPAGAAKGGGAIRQRVEESEARLTKDLDFVRPVDMDVDAFADAYSDRLETGWGGFTGLLRTDSAAAPDGVPVEYLMSRFGVKLRYLEQPFCTVLFELGHPEIDSVDAAVERLGSDIVGIFAEIGLPEPMPVKVMSAEHQVAQKIHACTGFAAAERAHDLVDIQILAAIEDLDHVEIGRIGQRLFAYRQGHEWPPTVVAHDGWNSLYAKALDDLVNATVHVSLEDAVALVNEIVAAAVRSTS